MYFLDQGQCCAIAWVVTFLWTMFGMLIMEIRGIGGYEYKKTTGWQRFRANLVLGPLFMLITIGQWCWAWVTSSKGYGCEPRLPGYGCEPVDEEETGTMDNVFREPRDPRDDMDYWL
jgi:hypothetical protein